VEKWPIGVFASIDAGLGVKLEVATSLGIPDPFHARTAPRARATTQALLDRLGELGITITAVFGGFEARAMRHPPVSARGPGAKAQRPRPHGDAGDRRLRHLLGATWVAHAPSVLCPTTPRTRLPRSRRCQGLCDY